MAPPSLPMPQRPPAPVGRWLGLLPGFLLAAGLLTTGAVWWSVRDESASALRHAFETQADALTLAVGSRLQAAGGLVQGAAGLFDAAPGLDRSAFEAYARDQLAGGRHPGVQGLGFAIPIAAVAPPQSAGGSTSALRPVGIPPFYAATTHYASPDGSPQPMGADLYGNPTFRAALDRASARGEVALSATFPLPAMDVGEGPTGFLAVAAVWRRQAGRRSLGGWTYAPVALAPLVEGAFAGNFDPRRLRLRISDGQLQEGAGAIFDSGPGSSGNPIPHLRTERKLEFGGQTWTLLLDALPAFSEAIPHPAGERILAAGALLSVVLAVLARILLADHRRVATALAASARANEDLQESKRRFRVLANSVPVLIWVGDGTGARSWFSRQWVDFTGCDPNTRAPYPWTDFIHPEDRPACLSRIAAACAAGEPFNVEYRLAHIDGSFHWVMDSAHPRFHEEGGLAGYIGSCVDIQARKTAEAGIRERESLLRSIYEASSAAIFLVGPDGRITHANQRMAEIFGRPMESLIGSEYVGLVVPGETQTAARNLQALLARDAPPVNLERLYVRGDGSRFWGLLSARPLANADGRVCGLVGVVADITAGKEAEAGMTLAAGVFEACHEGIFITDGERRIVSVNRAFTTITGYPAAEAIGKDPAFLASKRHPETFFQAMQHALDTTDHWEGEIWNRRREGPIYPAWLAITRITGTHGQVSNYVAIFSDISERKKTDARMHHLAHYDYLTDLPNRALLLERLTLIHSTARRYGKHFAVLYADLDLFKQVNDDYGHNTGDALLIEVARRLKGATRESDTVSRQGGDEFVILAPEIHEPVKLLEFAEKLQATIARPYDVHGHRITVAVSIGIAIYPRDGQTVDDIMRAADSAMYRAKNAGHNKVRFATLGAGGGANNGEPAHRALYLVGRGERGG